MEERGLIIAIYHPGKGGLKRGGLLSKWAYKEGA